VTDHHATIFVTEEFVHVITLSTNAAAKVTCSTTAGRYAALRPAENEVVMDFFDN